MYENHVSLRAEVPLVRPGEVGESAVLGALGGSAGPITGPPLAVVDVAPGAGVAADAAAVGGAGTRMASPPGPDAGAEAGPGASTAVEAI